MRALPWLMPALVTPFDRRGELDLKAHEHNLRSLNDRGVRGFLIAGSTGEGQYLEDGERGQLVATARATLGKRPTILCGLAGETERAALRQTNEAAEAGADGVLAITPTALIRGDTKSVVSYYRRLADQSPLPVLLYSVPRFTGYALPDEAVAELAKHPGIAGMKDSGGDPVRMQRLIAATPDDFVLFTGSSAAVRLAVTAGAHGAITASANYLPALIGEVVGKARRRAADDGSQQKLSETAGRIETAHGVPGVKAAAAGNGLRPGYPRLPLRPVGASLARTFGELARAADAGTPLTEH